MTLSKHLVESYEQKLPMYPEQPFRPTHPINPSLATPFGNRTMDSDASWMSGHGAYPGSNASTTGFSRWSEEKIAALQVRLARKLGPEYVTQRPGPGGGPKLSYIEGWKVINLANEVFGFNGWSSSIVSLTTDFHDVNKEGRSSCNVTAIIRITLADGSWHEDVGCGQSDNIKGKGAALDKAKKEAVTDGTKRALRTFGNVLGNCLYDRDYTKEVVKIKVPPAKFQQNDLERRPEFTPAGAPGPSRPSAIPPHMTSNPPPAMPPPVTPINHPEHSRPASPLTSINNEPEDVFMDESFDAEFLDESCLQFLEDKTNTSANLQPDAQAEPPRATEPPAPAYQHRHRPDPPAKPYQPSGAAARQAALLGAVSKPVDNPSPPEKGLNRSSGSTEPLSEVPKKPIGASAHPEARTPSTGSSARAQAISSAMGNPVSRRGSPVIPSGGIDAVAARAATSYSARAAALGLSEEITRESPVGFSSARGMKRSISTEEGSPTKQGSVMDRGPPREPLGELNGDGQGDWAKRVRV